jgi:hypothetical protein
VPVQLKDYDFLLTVDKIEEGQNWEDFIQLVCFLCAFVSTG